MGLFQRRVNTFILGGICAALAGCSTTRPPLLLDNLPEERRPIAELVQSLAKRNRELKSLRSLAGVNYAGPDGKHSFQEAVLVRRPDRLRLETLYPLGVLLIVTASPEEIAAYHTREGIIYRGKSTRENLWRFTQIPLSVPEATSLLMGLPPSGASKGEWRYEGPAIARDLGDGWKESVVFHPAKPLPIRWQLFNPAGKVELNAEFGDYADTPAGPFAMRLAVESPGQQRRLEITYKDPELNVDLAPALFVQKKPDNAREVALDSTGR
ncbi:MAG TPA: DUF4292 domain-containing protein [Candidatus Binatia bacterium]